MFLPYYITSEEVDRLTMVGKWTPYSYDEEYEVLSKIVQNTITAEMIEQNLIKGTKLQETWFPTDRRFHVFLSHSHKDKKQAKRLAAYLKTNFEVDVFIDSCYWGYCDKLLNKLDVHYCHYTDDQGKGWYSYERRNFTTSLIHIMLANALMEMMKRTECVIFLNSSNSNNTDDSLKYLKDQQTVPSAWIYQEISYVNSLEMQIPDRWYNALKYPQIRREKGELKCFSNESLADFPNVKFDADFSRFHQLTSDFFKGLCSVDSPELFMDKLHFAYLKDMTGYKMVLNEQNRRRTIRIRK